MNYNSKGYDYQYKLEVPIIASSALLVFLSCAMVKNIHAFKILICYLRLQEEYQHLEDEIKKTVEESKIVQEKYKSMYEDARREVGERNAQIEEVRGKVCSYS